METKRPFAPSFINRLDRDLLLNKPEIWSTRAHMVVYYGILFIAVLAAISFVVPDDPRTQSPASYWVGFVSLISLVAMIGWLIYLLRFNVFKRYGLTGPLNRLAVFLLYLLSTGIFVLFCYVEPYVETVRANAAYTDEEIVKDANSVNTNIIRLEYDSLRHKWSRDTVLVTARATAGERDDDMPVMYRPRPDVYDEDYGPVDTIVEMAVATSYGEIGKRALDSRLMSEDSVERIHDSMYVFLECPEYTSLYVYGADDYTSVKSLSSLELYRQVVVNYKPPQDKQALRNELSAIRKKYQWQEEYDYYYSRASIRERIRERYGLPYIGDSMDNLVERKHRWSAENNQVSFRILFYLSFALTLLLFSFRHSTAKTFFLTILTAIILTVLTSLMIAFSGYNDNNLLGIIMVYFIASLGVSIAAFSMKTRNVFAGIATNIFLWMLPFMPMCIVASYYENLRRRENYNFDNYDYSQEQLHMGIAEAGGVLLLLVMVATYFHYAYRKWYAAPEN